MLLNRLPGAAGGADILPPREGTRLKIGDYSHSFAGTRSAAEVTDYLAGFAREEDLRSSS